MKQKVFVTQTTIIARRGCRPGPAGKQLLVSVLGGGTKTLSGAGKELSTQMTGTVDRHRTYGGAKNFYFAA